MSDQTPEPMPEDGSTAVDVNDYISVLEEELAGRDRVILQQRAIIRTLQAGLAASQSLPFTQPGEPPVGDPPA